MNSIQKEEPNERRDTVNIVTFHKKYVIKRISQDGLIKTHEDISKYVQFDSEDLAFQYCADYDISDVIVIPMIIKSYF